MDINYKEGLNFYKKAKNYFSEELVAPKVDVYPIYGTNVSTPIKFVYKKDNDWDSYPESIFGDGDGTVPR